MHVGILGTGDVGRALGKGFVALGHDVRMGARDAKNEKALAWAREMGPKASAGTFADAAAFGEVVVLATLGVANESAIRMAGPGDDCVARSSSIPPTRSTSAVGCRRSWLSPETTRLASGSSVSCPRLTSSRPSTRWAIRSCSGPSSPAARRTCSSRATMMMRSKRSAPS